MRGTSTPDLVVAEFRSWCGQMDLASAYALRPLNRLVLDFVVWNRGWVNERWSGGYRTGDVGEDLREGGEVKDVKLIGDEVANGLGLRGVT